MRRHPRFLWWLPTLILVTINVAIAVWAVVGWGEALAASAYVGWSLHAIVGRRFYREFYRIGWYRGFNDAAQVAATRGGPTPSTVRYLATGDPAPDPWDVPPPTPPPTP